MLGGYFAPAQIRRFHWHEFELEEGALSDDPLGVAFEALLYLFCPGRKWNSSLEGMKAIIGFLQDKTKIFPTAEQLKTLRALLDQVPVDDDRIWDWFCDTYDP